VGADVATATWAVSLYSTTEIVYSEPLRILGEFLDLATQRDDPLPFTQQLRLRMIQLRPKHSVHSTHVFLRLDSSRRALKPSYSSPHKVLARTDKTFKIDVRGREVTNSVDRMKPAYTLEEGQHGNKDTKQPVPAAILSTLAATPKTTRCGRRV
jgi:hypothetical protein